MRVVAPPESLVWIFQHKHKIKDLTSAETPDENKRMQISGQVITGASGARPAFALAIDTTSIVTKTEHPREARLLPCGCVVGDLHGGLTFSDAIAAELATVIDGMAVQAVNGASKNELRRVNQTARRARPE